MDRARSEAMSVLAWLSFGRDLHAGQNAAKESVALARQSGDTKSLAFALQTLGLLSILQGNHRAGQKAAKEGAALARQTGDTMRLGWTLRILGLASAFLGDTTLAFDSLHEAEAIARQMDYKHLLMRVLGSLVMVTKGVYGQKAEDQAHAYLEERIALAQELGDTRTLMDSEADLALMELARGQFDQARTRIERVIAHDNEMGNQLALNQFRSEVAHIWRQLGYFEEALAIYRETVLFWQKIDHQGAVAHQLECFGFIAKAQEEWERAVKLLSAAQILREVSDSPLMPQGRAEKNKEIAELHAGMDEEVFNSLWAEGQVCLHGIQALILQAVGADLVREPNAAALLAQIQHQASFHLADRFERRFELVAAIAAQRSKRVACQTFRMQTYRHVRYADYIPFCDGNMLFPITVIFESNNMKIAKASRQLCHRYDAYTNFISAQPFTLMIALGFEQQIEFLMHSCCHMDLSTRYFNRTPPSSSFSTLTNLNGIAALLSRPGPAANVGADSPPKIIGAI